MIEANGNHGTAVMNSNEEGRTKSVYNNMDKRQDSYIHGIV